MPQGEKTSANKTSFEAEEWGNRAYLILSKQANIVDVRCTKRFIFSRYYALHDPIEHARRRTGGFVGIAIAVVWLVSCLICLPPLIGWNDWPGKVFC